ncbi:PH domain-containing protein [Bacillota bacterium Lsc_1132]
MSKPKRLHPIAIVIGAIKNLKEIIFPLIAFFFLGRKGDNQGLFMLLASFGSLILLIITSVLTWYRHTYHLEQGELRIEHGVFVRKKRYIPFERIQSMDLSEGILQRLFGLVKIQIETAGGDPGEKADAVLSAISRQEAQYIQEFFAAAKNRHHESTEHRHKEETPPVYRIHTAQLLLLSITSGGVGVVLSAVIAFLSQLDDFFSFSRYLAGFEKWAAKRMVIISVLIFIGFVLSWLIALVGTMLKYANFTVVKTEQDLIISQGLLERRQITIPLKRIQAIRISENILRQWLGYATVYVESAGGSFENKEGAKVMILPMIKLQQISAMLEPLLSDYQISLALQPLPKKALRRYIIRSGFFAVPIVIAAVVLFKSWGLLSLILLAAAVFSSFLKFKDAGWRIDQKQLTLRYRTIVRNTIFIKKDKIQALKVRESYFQRKNELATIEMYAKSGLGGLGGQLVDASLRDSEEIYSWYSNRAAKN